MMLLLDEERRVRRVNALACSFTGSTISDMVGRRSGEALRCIRALDIREGCGFDPDCHDCAIRNTVASTFGTGKSHNQVEASLPLSIQGKEQTLSFLLATTIVMVADQAMVLLTLQDINEYKKLEAQLQHAQKLESIGTFAGGIAHDFNNILTVVIGYAQLTIMHMSEDNPQRQNLEQIVVAANRAAHLTRDLLLFSRKQASVKKNIDLNEVIRSVEKFLLRVIGEDVSCKTVLPDKAMPVFADAHHIEQVLMNLATNARDAMAKGGEFTIAVEQAKLDHAFIAAHGFGNPGMYAVLAVSDSGSGMDEETRKQIFADAFCKIYPDFLCGDADWVNIMHADGAGTKSILAYLYWKETGDASVWKGIAQDAVAMNLDDLLCVGITNNILFSSTIDRNKLLIPGEVLEHPIAAPSCSF